MLVFLRMYSKTALKIIIGNALNGGIVSEEDVRLKFVDDLLKWLGFPVSHIAAAFPVYSFESGKKAARKTGRLCFVFRKRIRNSQEGNTGRYYVGAGS